MRSASPKSYLLALALLLSVLVAPRLARAGLIKLYMKDGSYQLVSTYEIHGDRVRYLSAERSEWEEVPVSLVDFDATQRAQAQEKLEDQKRLQDAKELEHERFYKPPDTGLEVAPGVRLPGDDGVFTLDGKRLVRMVQSSTEVVTDKKRAAMVLAVPLPVVKTRSLVVLEGAKATVRLNDPLPVFYVQSSNGLGMRLELVRLKPGKETRVVEDVETGRRKGAKSEEERATVAIQRKQLAPNVYTLKPLEPLDAGEYVLGEVVDEKLALDVYDFGYEKWEAVK